MMSGPQVTAVGLVLHPTKPVDRSVDTIVASGPRGRAVRTLAREIDRHRLPVEVVSVAEFVAEVDGIICWRRLDEWNRAGVWQRLHELLLAELRGAGQLDWSRAVIDSSHVRAARRGPKVARARSTAPAQAPSTTS